MKDTARWILPAVFVLVAAFPLKADVSLNTAALALRFSEQGSLVEATICFPLCDDATPRMQHMEDANGIISFGQVMDSRWVQRRRSKCR